MPTMKSCWIHVAYVCPAQVHGSAHCWGPAAPSPDPQLSKSERKNPRRPRNQSALPGPPQANGKPIAHQTSTPVQRLARDLATTAGTLPLLLHGSYE